MFTSLPTAPTDYCNPNPCVNGGQCNPSSTDQRGFTCTCPDGFSGTNCDLGRYINLSPFYLIRQTSDDL